MSSARIVSRSASCRDIRCTRCWLRFRVCAARLDFSYDRADKSRCGSPAHALDKMLVVERIKRLPTTASVEELAAEGTLAHLLHQRSEKRLRDPCLRGIHELGIVHRIRFASRDVYHSGRVD